jgi:ketosteroid isomerase-like protein
MPGDNIELARHAFEAFQARELDGFGEYCDPQIEIQPAINVLEQTILRGPSAPRQFLETIEEAWDSLQGTIERLTEVDGGRVMAEVHVSGRSRASGVPIDQQLVWMMTFRERKLSRIEAFSSADEARRTANTANREGA